MRWLNDHLFLLVMSGICVTASGVHFHKAMKYRGVESWPSVSAEMIRSGDSEVTVPRQSRHSWGTSSVDTSFVEFEYTVDGQTYRSMSATPNGGGVRSSGVSEPWRAFYKPSAPDIAVLSPVPFKGGAAALIAVATGLMAVMYAWFSFPAEMLFFLRRKLFG
ncbi:MAG: DUF3592 domain-containing protein [Verrucomicrobiaceae bacterium]|nr:MAG: DUF3592 domain-containing protein [Verrucomicrobiaceae bacterium]